MEVENDMAKIKDYNETIPSILPNKIIPPSKTLRKKSILDKFITLLCVLLTVYMFYATVYGPYKTTIVHRALFLVVMLFIFFSSEGKLKIGKEGKYDSFCKIIDWIFIAASTVSLGYIIINYEKILGAMGATSLKTWEIYLGILLIVCVLEAARRTSKTFFILAVLGVIYTLFGASLPGILNHPGISLRRMVFLTAFIEEGIFGLGISVASTYLFMFILFGATLTGTGASQYLMDLANGIVGHHDGGAAKTAVVGSAVMGTVSGSSISNVVTTGSITIPLMKKLGFEPHVAAAIEVTASEGGQLMPPVMGAAAFIMAEMTGIPYSTIVIAAIIPAFLYFFNAFFIVHFEAKKNGIKGLEKNEIPNWRKVLAGGWHIISPIILLFYLLMVKSNTAMYAGMFCIIVTIIAAQMRKHTRLKLREIIAFIEEGVRNVASIVAILAGLGLVSQAIIITGLGARLSEILVKIAGGTTIGIVIISVVVTLILGSGMTTPIAYSLVAMFVAPTLVGAGFPVLASHLFLFFFAIKSGSTPPVAVVAAVASGIAGADFWKTAIKGTIFGTATYLIAFGYLINPAILMIGEPIFIALTCISAGIGTIAMASAVQGWMFGKCVKFERFLLFLGAITLIVPNIFSDIIGMIIVSILFFNSFRKYKPVSIIGKSLISGKQSE